MNNKPTRPVIPAPYRPSQQPAAQPTLVRIRQDSNIFRGWGPTL